MNITDWQGILLWDNGHGVNTPGKRSPIWPEPDGYQLFEYDFNRKLANRCHVMAQAIGFNSVLIVPEIEDVPLHVRYKRVNRYKPMNPIFISVHGNAANTPQATGWECFTSRGYTIADELAKHLYAAAQYFLGDRFKIRRDFLYPDMPDLVGKEADFAMVRGVDKSIPAVLTENLFMTNRTDCDFMNSEEGLDILARLHIAGITKFIQEQFTSK